MAISIGAQMRNRKEGTNEASVQGSDMMETRVDCFQQRDRRRASNSKDADANAIARDKIDKTNSVVKRLE